MIHGIQPNKLDVRDLDFHKMAGTQLANLPSELYLDANLWMPNQSSYEPIFGNPPLAYGCTDYATNDVCADQDGVLYNPAYTESITHYSANGGGDVRTSLLTAAKKGTQTKDGKILMRTGVFNVQKYDILDYFDSIRYAMLPTLGEKRSVSWGGPWYKEWEDAAVSGVSIMPTPKTYSMAGLPWHNSKFCGWKTINGIPYLINKSWQGTGVGDKGFLYFPREVVNAVMAIQGTCAFTVSKLINSQPGKTISVSFLSWVYSVLANIFTPSIKIPTMPSITNVPPPDILAPVPLTTPVVPTSTTYLWDNAINSRHSVRVICDEEGLSLDDKNIITACIMQESRFDNNAVCKNKSADGSIWSSDWGICQINDYYQVGAGKPFPSVKYILDNPESCVRWMIKMMKAGQLKLWSSYSQGTYKQWLV